jgi:hypothetical protein
MLAAVANLLPVARNFARQIVPPVVATLIAALLIAGFNRAFSTHMVQPRMAALHGGAGEATRPIIYAANPHEAVMVTEVARLSEEPQVERVFAKEGVREAGKDQGTVRLATAAPVPAAATTPAPAAAPVTPRVVLRKSEQPAEPRQTESRQVEQRVAAVPAVVAPAPVIAAPPVVAQQPIPPLAQPPIVVPAQPPQGALPPVAQEPPPVIAAKPMVTVPDRPRPPYPGQAYPNQAYPNQAYPNHAYPNQAYPGYDPRQAYEPQQADADPDLAPRERRPLERFVDAIKPSSIFNRMREFGDRIEAAGNEILPNIRQQ